MRIPTYGWETMRKRVKIFKALAGETRLRILYHLMKNEACVTEIQQAIGISQTITSHHLGILQNAGLLKSRREGQRTLYSLDTWSIKQNCRGLELMVRKACESD